MFTTFYDLVISVIIREFLLFNLIILSLQYYSYAVFSVPTLFSLFTKKSLAFYEYICYYNKGSSKNTNKNTIWFVGQAAKTSPSHGENRGSIPLRTAHLFSLKCFRYKAFRDFLFSRTCLHLNA